MKLDSALVNRNLALEFVRVTEIAAIAASRWIGLGDKENADKAAADAMRAMLHTVSMDGTVVIGEGEKDQAPMLYNGEHIGNGQPPKVDLAIDPLEGTTLTARGQPNALTVLAACAGGKMYSAHAFYMEKIACGSQFVDVIDIRVSPRENIERVAKIKGVPPYGVSVMVLDKERNQPLIEELRKAGARISLIPDGDVAAAIAAGREEDTDVDLLMGIGGTPEGIISAAALKCLGGAIQGKLWPRNQQERDGMIQAGLDPKLVLTTNDLISGDDIFFAATGVTNGRLLKGVQYIEKKIFTHSIVMRSRSGTVRYVEAFHTPEKVDELLK